MEPVDWAALKEQCADDEGLVREVVELYRREWRGLFGDLQRAEAQADLPACKRSAHRLKGALLSLAAKPAAGVAQALEQAAAAGDGALVKSLLAALSMELDRLAAALG
jgi:HPt (histidine-containing phosphotransfer) domain-containing protein